MSRLTALGPASPCVGLCRIDGDSGCCAGCYRTLDEICRWLEMDPVERGRVVDRCEQRRRQASPGVGGPRR